MWCSTSNYSSSNSQSLIKMSENGKQLWFGLTGRNASGKTTVCEYLRDKKGFTSCSCSDSIRAHLRQNGLEVNRENLIKGGRELRSKGGAGVLAEMLLISNKDVPNLAVDSIRTPDEVNALKQQQSFKLIEVRVNRDIRWERMVKRGRQGDPSDFETFVQQEEAELKASDSSGQALDATASKADIVIDNEGDLQALYKKIDDLLQL